MNPLTTVLTILLGGGGLAGLATLLKFRAERGAIVVDTVAKGILVLERLNDRLEADLVDERAEVIRLRRELSEARARIAELERAR
jgi:predicted ATPase